MLWTISAMGLNRWKIYIIMSTHRGKGKASYIYQHNYLGETSSGYYLSTRSWAGIKFLTTIPYVFNKNMEDTIFYIIYGAIKNFNSYDHRWWKFTIKSGKITVAFLSQRINEHWGSKDCGFTLLNSLCSCALKW